jgi:CheY-like chemotaxis protein
MKIRVLWIDDGAVADLVELTGPVYSSGRYALEIALTISEAVAEIQRREFDVVIVDIRLPPGELREWVQLYQDRGQSRSSAQLGLDFLTSCFGANPKIELNPRPKWLRSEKFGVFTVEEEEVAGAQVRALGIRVYRQKNVDPPRRTLVQLIEDIYSNA